MLQLFIPTYASAFAAQLSERTRCANIDTSHPHLHQWSNQSEGLSHLIHHSCLQTKQPSMWGRVKGAQKKCKESDVQGDGRVPNQIGRSVTKGTTDLASLLILHFESPYHDPLPLAPINLGAHSCHQREHDWSRPHRPHTNTRLATGQHQKKYQESLSTSLYSLPKISKRQQSQPTTV